MDFIEALQATREEILQKAANLSPAESRKRYYLKNLDSIRAHEKEVRQAHREKMDAIKLESGCVDCGYALAAVALHFDHLPGHEKVKNISQMAGWRWERIEAELAKCEVVCANCHSIRTQERRDGV